MAARDPRTAAPSGVGTARDLEWYRFGMSKQIAVRLPDHLVEFVDGLVTDGEAKSRAAVVTRALERERRRAGAET